MDKNNRTKMASAIQCWPFFALCPEGYYFIQENYTCNSISLHNIYYGNYRVTVGWQSEIMQIWTPYFHYFPH